MAASLSVDLEGASETQRALEAAAQELAARPRPPDRQCATMLAAKLVQAAGASGVPVAPRVARSVRPTERAVSIGPGVGRSGGPSYALAWGSEKGPAGAVNHFAVPPSSGYWIKPTVDQFKADTAPDLYNRWVTATLGKAGF